MIKTFKDYLMESRRSYSYRVKIAGETDAEFFKQFEKELARFDVIRVTEPKRAPVMKTLPGFPDSVANEELHSLDIELNYPANAEQIKQILVDMGKNPNYVCVIDPQFADSEAKAAAETAKNSGSEALLNRAYEDTTQEQAAAAGEYANGYQTAAKNTEQVKYKFAGEVAKDAEFTSDLPQGQASPLTSAPNAKVSN